MQVGDPFTEKKLIECSLELLDARPRRLAAGPRRGRSRVVDVARWRRSGGVGIELELDRVPLREPGMQPFEIMISESQERMAAVVEPARLAEVEAVCARWELPCTVIGRVIDDGRLRCRCDGEVVGDLPVAALVDDARATRSAPSGPSGLAERRSTPAGVPRPDDAAALLLRLLGGAEHRSKTWVYEQYDQVVGSGTVVRPGRRRGRRAPDAVASARSPSHSTATARASRSIRAAAAPRPSPQAALNVACSGAEPAAITNCLNFGNPERRGTAVRAARGDHGHGGGLRGARRRRSSPATSRSTTKRRRADPPDAGRRLRRRARARRARRPPRIPRRAGDAVLLLGTDGAPALDGSEYQAHGRRPRRGPHPRARTCRRCAALRPARRRRRADGLLRSAHDVVRRRPRGRAGRGLRLGLGMRRHRPLTSPAARDVTLFGEGRGRGDRLLRAGRRGRRSRRWATRVRGSAR